MILALIVLLLVAPIEHEARSGELCPTQIANGSSYDALGYVRVIKDGYRIAGGTGYYDPRTSVLTAWFSGQRSMAQVAVTLDLRTNAAVRIRLHTEGRGSIRLHRGAFCAYPESPPKPSCDYGGCPSPMPSYGGFGRASLRAAQLTRRFGPKLTL